MIWIRREAPKFLAVINFKTGFSTMNHIMDEYVEGWEMLTEYQLKNLCSERDLSDYYKFSFVRNPYARVASAFQQKLREKPKERIENEWFDPVWPMEDNQRLIMAELVPFKHRDNNDLRKWLPFLLEISFETFVDVLRVVYRRNKHFTPQLDLLTDWNGDLIPDRLYRLENLRDHWDEIMDQLGVSVPYVEKNSTDRPHYSTFYSDRSRQIVSELYRSDIEKFKYEFEYD